MSSSKAGWSQLYWKWYILWEIWWRDLEIWEVIENSYLTCNYTIKVIWKTEVKERKRGEGRKKILHSEGFVNIKVVNFMS